jgi:hypothetical protein
MHAPAAAEVRATTVLVPRELLADLDSAFLWIKQKAVEPTYDKTLKRTARWAAFTSSAS